MNSSNYTILSDILKELRQESDVLQQQIDECTLSMKEKESYIQSFLDREDRDLKIFSPRNVENIYKDEIELADRQKSDLLENLKELYRRQNLLSSKIDRLNQVISDEDAYHSDCDVRSQNLSILNIQEEDRQRIARDLHDTSLQNLAHIIHKVELSSLFIDQDVMRAKIELSVVSKSIRDVIDEIRNTIFDLRPMTFDDLGLKPALSRLLDVVNENKKYHMDILLEDVSCENELILVSIYRVIQECFNNISKHSDADYILFHCTQTDDICKIRIEDNGIGFSSDDANQDKHFGLNVMKERVYLLGGKISIDSQKNVGTKIYIEIPLGL